MSSRLAVAAFVALAAATVVAFFGVQSLKVSTPLISGLPKPHPARIDPVSGGVCPLKGIHGVVPTSFRAMTISFLLLNQADDVTVRIVTASGAVVDTIARSRHMAINRRASFRWDGHRADGSVAPSGDYYVEVSLLHQHRTVRIANASTGGAEPVVVQDTPTPITITGVRADGAEPAVIPQASGRSVAIHFTVVGSTIPTVRIYRTDVTGRPQLVNTFPATSRHTAFWNGALANGRPAPQGTYLASVSTLDRTCTRTTFPTTIPPAAGSVRHAGVTIRYLAAQPPATAVAPGATANVLVDSRRHRYSWSLFRAGSARALASGQSSSVSLPVRLPAGGDGLYELALRYGTHRTAVPLVAGVSAAAAVRRSAAGRVLVVLPALTWQGLNPVDDDGDGMPNTLTAGTPIQLARPFTDGLPAGIGSIAGLLSWLRAHGDAVTLTTDLTLIADGGALLHGYSGLVLAGDETWLPQNTGAALSTWVTAGGHLLSLGVGSLQRAVTVSNGEASDPSPAHAVDMLSARPLGVRPTAGALLLVDLNHQGLFSSRSQALSGFRSYQAFGPVQAPARLLTSAGTSASTPAVIGYALGRGAVVDIGLPGFGSALAHDVTAQDLMARSWRLLSH